ncbi:DNA polymerase III subunit delta [Porticoccus sp.]|uniref:DNA polymerase III subunit delta n=1 Tax=Porticoccus sp. TaxID=2024853 RepID=UPI003F69D15F
MRLKAEQLGTHLSRRELAPLYLVSGDETLLAQEVADAIRAEACLQGFTEREILHAEGSFDWNTVLTEANSLSLFADKKIIEIRMPGGKPGEKGSKVLLEYTGKPTDDTLLLIITPKLDAAAMRSKWIKAIESHGVLIQTWPVPPDQLPGWIGKRLQQAGIRADRQAVEILADRVEGNLLAAIQEIEKLKLLLPDGEVDGQTMSTVVADSARFNVFTLADKALEGDPQAVCRTLRGLRDEGAEPTIILWALTRELRTLIRAAEALENGDHLDWVLKNLGIWEKRKPLVKQTLRRLKLTRLKQMLRLAAGIDRAIKGMRIADPWDDLTILLLMFCGTPTLKPGSLRLALSFPD